MKQFKLLATCVLLCLVALSCEALTKSAQQQGLIDKNQAEGLNQAGEGISELSKETSLKDERDLGETVALQAYATPGFGTPLKSEDVMRYLAMLTSHIGRYSERPLIPYFTAVIDSDEINAFAVPGGYIFITKAAIQAMKNEAELASVIAHEIAHINKKHAINEIKKVKGFSAIASGAGKAAGGEQFAQFDGLVKDLAKMVMGQAFSKSAELEADVAGAQYAIAAGYDARGLADFLNTLNSGAGHQQGSVTSTHPTPGERIQNLNDYFKTIPADEWEGLVKETSRFARIKAALNTANSW